MPRVMHRQTPRQGSVRAVVVILLFMIFAAAAGSVAAVYLQKPIYRSEGLVRLRGVVPALMEPDRLKPGYDSFKIGQVALIKSRAVLDMALIDPIWRNMNVAAPQPDELLGSITVSAPRNSEYLTIECLADQPARAAATVNAVTNAYAERFRSEEDRIPKERLGALEQIAMTQAQQIAKLQQQLENASQEFGTTHYSQFIAAYIARLNKIDDALLDDKLGHLPGAASTSGPAPTTQSAEARHKALMDLRESVRRDLQSMNATADKCQRLESELAELKKKQAVIQNRIEALRNETMLPSSMSIVSTGEIPTEAESRWNRHAVRRGASMGGGAALLLSLVVVAARGKRD